MDDRVRELVEGAMQTVVGLDTALFYQANPHTFDTPEGLAQRIHHGLADIRAAVERLAEAGILERYERGEGRYICYGLTSKVEVWHLLCLVSEAYLDDAESRKEIVRILVKRQREDHAGRHAEHPAPHEGQ